MILLITGIIFWYVFHGFKAFFPKTRQLITNKMGEEKSKGPFAIGILLSIALIVIGWRSANPANFVFIPIHELKSLAYVLIAFGIYLIVGSTQQFRLHKWIHHPQLTGFSIWAIAHLLLNGELRSVLLFGGFAAWGILTIVFITKRDGKVSISEPGTWINEVKPIVIAAITIAILLATHRFYAGIPLIYW